MWKAQLVGDGRIGSLDRRCPFNARQYLVLGVPLRVAGQEGSIIE